MSGLTPGDRRALARSLTRILNAPVEQALGGLAELQGGGAHRIGITGAPGAGKSTLISRLAERRLQRGRRIGVLAIDPTSPISQGSLLGDRVRMEGISANPDLYIRSVPSRRSHDGLCDNVADLLLAMDAADFDDLILETVGVGQAEFAVRSLVDSVVLVLLPESGDTIQAMKAGILEMADVIVVNKADLPGANRIRTEVNTIIRRKKHEGGWLPPVIMASATEETGIAELDDAVERHRAWRSENPRAAGAGRERIKYHVQNLIARRVGELLDELSPGLVDGGLKDLYARVIAELRNGVEAEGRRG